MSMSDARMFAELTARVAELENRMSVLVAQIALAQADIHDHIEGKDVSDEVLGPVADPEALILDRTARDGLRTLLERGGVTVAEEAVPAAAGVVPEVSDLATDPLLKDKLAALQGAESVASTAAPAKPGSTRK